MAIGDSAQSIFLTTLLSHFALLPALAQLIHRRWMYEVFVACFSLVTSIMYHSCQTFNIRLFLTELQWHRLDNIAALSCFSCHFVYLCNFRSVVADRALKYALFFVGMVSQEADPWNVAYTFGPIGCFAAVPVVYYAIVRRRMPSFAWKNFVAGYGALLVATFFFVLGLDDAHDPWRLYHGLWHVCLGVACLYMWRIVRNPILATVTYNVSDDDK